MCIFEYKTKELNNRKLFHEVPIACQFLEFGKEIQ